MNHSKHECTKHSLTKKQDNIISAASSSTILQTISYEQTRRFDVKLSSWMWNREESCYSLFGVNEWLFEFLPALDAGRRAMPTTIRLCKNTPTRKTQYILHIFTVCVGKILEKCFTLLFSSLFNVCCSRWLLSAINSASGRHRRVVQGVSYLTFIFY